MDLIPGRFLANPTDPEERKRFLEAARTGTTHDINATRVEADLYLAQTIATASQEIGSSLAAFAKALADSAEASSRHAASLKWATWALVVATLVLAGVAALPVFLR